MNFLVVDDVASPIEDALPRTFEGTLSTRHCSARVAPGVGYRVWPTTAQARLSLTELLLEPRKRFVGGSGPEVSPGNLPWHVDVEVQIGNDLL